jgi:hypothetical protein
VRSRFKPMAILVVLTALLATGFGAWAGDGSEALQATLRKQAGDGSQIRETTHWLIVHHADPKWVDDAAAMLERTHDHFFEQFDKAGFHPQPLHEKLVCVLLGTQEEFVEYLQRVRDAGGQPSAKQQPPERGKAKPRTGLGSYRERTNRIEMCDLRAILAAGGRKPNAARLELENVARIAHEAAHQLSFNTGILKRQLGYPPWLGEGLAVNFEFSDAAKPFGPLTTNFSPRAARLKQLCADGKLVPLKDMVTMSPSETSQPENRSVVYVQGWGLFRFLFTERPGQLKQYLAALADRPPGPVRRADVLAAFETAFGPIDVLNQGWEQFLKRLRASQSEPSQGGTSPNLFAPGANPLIATILASYPLCARALLAYTVGCRNS